MPTTLASDGTAVYAEVSTFDDNNSDWTLVGTTVRNSPSPYTSFYRNPRAAQTYSFNAPGDGIKIVFGTPQDWSRFLELACWVRTSNISQANGILIQITANGHVYTHQMYVEAPTWLQDVWNFGAVPNNDLRSVTQIQIIATAACTASFDEMVVRIPGMLEPVLRDVVYLLDGKVILNANDNPNFAVPAFTRDPEFYQRQVSPAFLISLDAPKFDNSNVGRVDNQDKRVELIPQGSFYVWRVRKHREAYNVGLRIRIYSKYGLESLTLQEYVLKTFPARGALAVAGDLIDCILVDTLSLPGENENQDEFVTEFVYELWTWKNSDTLLVPAVQSAQLTDPLNSHGVPLKRRPDTYVTEQNR